MDQALKQRLVGATVLIILGVIVLPMLLSGQPALHNETRRIEVPDQPPELSMETRRFPIGDPAESDASVVPVARPDPPADEVIPGTDSDRRPEADVETRQEGEQLEPETDPAAGSVETATSGETEPGRYLVQVASFSNPGNANQLSSLLTENRMPVVTDTVETAAGRLHRVRVGPYDDLDAARAALEQIGAIMADLNPRVVDLRPDENAPVADPSDPLVRWIVQAGSFADRNNALELLSQLKAAGFAAFLETVNAAGTTSHKVKVGPVIERQAAVNLERKLAREMSIDGIVMSMD